MNPKIAVDKIRKDRQHGASQLTRQALELIEQTALHDSSDNIEAFQAFMSSLLDELALCRPTMVSIANAVNQYRSKLKQQLALSPDLHLPALRQIAVKLARDCINELETSRQQVIENGASLISSEMTIMTCSYSSAVIACLLLARRQGKFINLLAAQSQLAQHNPAYGELLIEELVQQNIPGQVFPDKDVESLVERVDLILLGADAVLADGSLINGYPSLNMARVAFDSAAKNIPVYVLCETLKFTTQKFPLSEEGFDTVPATYLTGIITEKEIIAPDAVKSYQEIR
jgi:ribose 1,5-bisphosphate isomerase